MNEFQLITDPKNVNWVDVKYPDEKYPRYMINRLRRTCTCQGDTMRQSGKPQNECKHLKELFGDGNAE